LWFWAAARPGRGARRVAAMQALGHRHSRRERSGALCARAHTQLTAKLARDGQQERHLALQQRCT
jgi:hypothetical protein